MGHFFGHWERLSWDLERFAKKEGGFRKRRGDFMLWCVFLMMNIEIQISISERSSGWAINYDLSGILSHQCWRFF